MGETSLAGLWEQITRGRLDDAATLAVRLLDTATDDTLRAGVESAVGLMYRRVGRLAESADAYWRAASRVSAGPAQASYRAEAAASLFLGGQLDRAEVAARASMDDGERFDNRAAAAQGLAAFALVRHARGSPSEGLGLGRRAHGLIAGPGPMPKGDPLTHVALACALMDLDRLDEADGVLTDGLALIAASGTQAQAAWLLSLRCLCRALAGRVDQALADGADALLAADSSGATIVRPLCWGVMAILKSGRGDQSGAEHLLEAGGRNRLGGFSGWGEEWLLLGKASVAGSRQERFDRLAEAWHHSRGLPWFLPWRVIAPPLVDAAVDGGDHDYAATVATEARKGAEAAAGVASADAVALHCAGLATSDPVVLARAVESYRLAGRPFMHGEACLDAARVHLAHGDPAGALALAKEAEEMFRSLRLSAWSARVGAVLSRLATVPRPREAEPDPLGSLTPSERGVARLAADGLTNSEIARFLQISPRTVQTHLGHIYDKLELSSRVQLANLVSART